MKVGEKYIIEIEEVIQDELGLVARIKGFDSLFLTPRGLRKLKKIEEPRCGNCVNYIQTNKDCMGCFPNYKHWKYCKEI